MLARLTHTAPAFILAALLAVSLSVTSMIREGHADSPIAATADDVQPLGTGERAPTFVVRNVKGDNVNFDPSNMERPLVLITFRGGWCPYCNLHLSELRHVLPEIQKQDVDVWFLSGDRPDQLYRSLEPETRDDVESLGYTLLSDADAQAAIAFGIAFRSGDGVANWLESKGKDYEGSGIDRHGVLPVPAVYAIDRSGEIVYAYTNADYRVRLPADELLEVTASL